jgi:hypothetical protein
MTATEEAKRIARRTILRVVRMERRAQAVEASLRRQAEAGCAHPELARALVLAGDASRDSESLLSRLAAHTVKYDPHAGGTLPN